MDLTSPEDANWFGEGREREDGEGDEDAQE